MIDMVQVVGRAVENQIPKTPETAKNLLIAAYGWVTLAGHFPRQASYGQAVERFNGAIAQTIVKTLVHPENAALVNIFFPCELLQGMNINPMFPEVISAYVANTQCCGCFAEYAESQNVPETFCSYHKTMIGMGESQVLPAPALIANTTLACDANQVSFRRLAEYYHVPHLVVDVPHTPNEQSVAFVENQLYELIASMELILQRSFDMSAFHQAIRNTNETLALMKRYYQLRGEVTLPTSTTGVLMEMLATHLMMGTDAAKQFAASLVSLAERAPYAMESRKPRIFWMHTLPNWQPSMRDIFDGIGSSCEIVGNDMVFDSYIPIDEERPFRSIAERIVYNSMNGSGKRRIENALAYAKSLQADGIIVFCHWGCKQTLGISQMAKTAFEQAGFPTLVLDGDGCDPRNVADGQMITRINAFAEQLGGELVG